MTTTSTDQTYLPPLLPFGLSFVVLALVVTGGWFGGVWLALSPLFGWFIISYFDQLVGRTIANPDPGTPDTTLWAYRALTMIWAPVQLILIFGGLYYAIHSGRLVMWEQVVFMITIGLISGAVGIVYAHELMHQSNRLERWLGDILMTSVLYGHFRSEHLLVHHRYVGTPRDPVTARYNEGFHRFFPRVLVQCFRSALGAEGTRLAKRGISRWHRSNPFWIYAGLQAAFTVTAFAIGGWWGVLLFVIQAFYAVLELELTNYVEHYGLTRKHLGDGKYEHCQPHHSWNADHTVTNFMLINLQRHSDHHYKPNRRFPLLQTYDADEAPQLPFGYPLMTLMATIPPLYKRVMNPRVKAWRKRFYPDIEDWHPYNKALTPQPR